MTPSIPMLCRSASAAAIGGGRRSASAASAASSGGVRFACGDIRAQLPEVTAARLRNFSAAAAAAAVGSGGGGSSWDDVDHRPRLGTWPSIVASASASGASSSARVFSTETSDEEEEDDDFGPGGLGGAGSRSPSPSPSPPYPDTPKRVWKSAPHPGGVDFTAVPPGASLASELYTPTTNGMAAKGASSSLRSTWEHSVDDASARTVKRCLDRITEQERQGGRMRQSQMGVVRTDPGEDMRLMIENYTVPALATALRDREDILQLCASLLAQGEFERLSEVLRPFERRYVQMRRKREDKLDLTSGFGGAGGSRGGGGGFANTSSLEMLRRGLSRMPRRVGMAHQRRAGVVLPLCDVGGVPCILFEKRSRHLRAHPDEVCLPGGMVSLQDDKSIVSTCLREMGEEIEGLDLAGVVVLGVLRCNWGEVHHLTGIAVTPVVCYIGEISHLSLEPNPDEVAECFTVPLVSILDRERWVHREGYAPIFTGGPHIIWGLTGYIVERFVKDVLARYNVEVPPTGTEERRQEE